MADSKTLTKPCTACGLDLPLDAFGLHPTGKQGRQPKCRKCLREVTRQWNKNHPGKKYKWDRRWVKEHPDLARKYGREWARRNSDKNWAYKIKRDFGLTTEKYFEMLAEQGGKCAICESSDPVGGLKRFPVDHCHATNKVRGLLCGSCNRALGLFKDDRYILERAIAYLTKHQE